MSAKGILQFPSHPATEGDFQDESVRVRCCTAVLLQTSCLALVVFYDLLFSTPPLNILYSPFEPTPVSIRPATFPARTGS